MLIFRIAAGCCIRCTTFSNTKNTNRFVLIFATTTTIKILFLFDCKIAEKRMPEALVALANAKCMALTGQQFTHWIMAITILPSHAALLVNIFNEWSLVLHLLFVLHSPSTHTQTCIKNFPFFFHSSFIPCRFISFSYFLFAFVRSNSLECSIPTAPIEIFVSGATSFFDSKIFNRFHAALLNE